MTQWRARVLALFGAAAFFLWMFFAAAPLETLADTGGLVARNGADVVREAYRVAADWRHGMAGNSPLYMPGFFALAVTAWMWSASATGRMPVRRIFVEGGTVLVAASIAAWISSSAAAPAIIAAFERSAHAEVVASWPAVPGRAIAQGLYTAAAWMTTVVACQRALARRSFTPLLVIPPITVLLMLIRPWTVDDFVALWIERARMGDVAALGSAAAIPFVSWMLVLTGRPPQWVQIHRRRERTCRDV